MEQLKHCNSNSFRGCNMSCFNHVLHHIATSLLMSWRNIIFTCSVTFIYKYGHLMPLPGSRRWFHVNFGLSNNDQWRCGSVSQTSALLHGNKWTSLQTLLLCCVLLQCVAWRYKVYRFIVHNIHVYVFLCNEMNTTFCCKFTELHSHQILLKLVNTWLSYCENQKSELFL